MKTPPQSNREVATGEVITPGQLVAGIFVLTLCGTMYYYPTAALGAVGRSGWLLVPVATGLSILTGAIGYGIVARVPGKLLPDIILELAGPRLGRAAALFLALLFVLRAAIDYRAAIEPIGTTFFTDTPLWAITAVLALPTTYLAWTGPVRMARLYPLFALIITSGMALVLALGSDVWDYGHLLPLTTLDNILIATPHFGTAVVALQTVAFVGFLAPYLPKKRAIKGFQYFLAGLAPAVLFFIFFTIIPVAAFTGTGARTIQPPFMTSLGTLTLAWSPLTRIEFLLRLLFQINAIAAISMLQYGAALLLSRVFRFRNNLLGILLVAVPPVALTGWYISDQDALLYVELGIIGVNTMLIALLVVLWILAWRYSKRAAPGK
jgi:hypothetical protein